MRLRKLQRVGTVVIAASALMSAATVTASAQTIAGRAPGTVKSTLGSAGSVSPKDSGFCGSICVLIKGSSNFLTGAYAELDSNPDFYQSDYGHLQVRWNNGQDDYRNSVEGTITNQGFTGLAINSSITPGTYICERWWTKNSNGTYSLNHGDWACTKL
jgi:hypothetical protein